MADCCPPARTKALLAHTLAGSHPGGRADSVQPTTPRGHAPVPPTGLVGLPGGAFRMGTDDAEGFPEDGEGPVRDVTVAPFTIGACAVANDEYAAFVDATGFHTDAERFGWSFVFARFLSGPLRAASPRPEATPWWCGVAGAMWEAPEGPGSNL